MRPRLLLTASVVLVAGCVGPEPSRDPSSDPLSDRTSSELIAFSIPAGASAASYADPNGGDVEVASNAWRLDVQATWTCASPSCDLVVVIRDPDGEPVAQSEGSGEAAVSHDRPEAGTWNVAVFPKTAVVSARGELNVTLTYRTEGTP